MGWVFSEGLQNKFETAVVNEPSVVEPLKFYCNLQINEMTVNELYQYDSLQKLVETLINPQKAHEDFFPLYFLQIPLKLFISKHVSWVR